MKTLLEILPPEFQLFHVRRGQKEYGAVKNITAIEDLNNIIFGRSNIVSYTLVIYPGEIIILSDEITDEIKTEIDNRKPVGIIIHYGSSKLTPNFGNTPPAPPKIQNRYDLLRNKNET
jgi:hypothetical protein